MACCGAWGNPPTEDLADDIPEEVASSVLAPDDAEVLKEHRQANDFSRKEVELSRATLASAGHAPPTQKAKGKTPPLPKLLNLANAIPDLPPGATLYEDPKAGRVRVFMKVWGERRSKGYSKEAMSLNALLTDLLAQSWSWHKEATGQGCPWPSLKKD